MSVRRQTQKDKVKEYLLQGNSITPIDAFEMFGCFRLAAIIWSLKHDDGMKINTKFVSNKYGVKFGSYSLIEQEPVFYVPLIRKKLKIKKMSDKNAKLLDKMNPSGKWREFISEYKKDDKRHKNV